MSALIQSAPLCIAATTMEQTALTFDQLRVMAVANSISHAKPTCNKRLKVGIFFDGTNNNRQRDKLDHGHDRMKQCHSNIASLFGAHKDVEGEETEQDDNCFRYYVPV